jgi:hypothetical protein
MKRSILLSCLLAALSFGPLRAADPSPSPADKPGKPMPGMARHHGGPGGWGHSGKMMNSERPRGPFKGGCDGGACPQGMKACAALGMLQLTDEQQTKVKDAMKALQPKIEAIRAEEEAKISSLVADAVRPLLDEKQQAVFDDMQKLRKDKAELKAAAPAEDKKSE